MTLKPIIIKLTTFQLCSKRSTILNSYTTAFIHSKVDKGKQVCEADILSSNSWSEQRCIGKELLPYSKWLISLWWLSYHYNVSTLTWQKAKKYLLRTHVLGSLIRWTSTKLTMNCASARQIVQMSRSLDCIEIADLLCCYLYARVCRIFLRWPIKQRSSEKQGRKGRADLRGTGGMSLENVEIVGCQRYDSINFGRGRQSVVLEYLINLQKTTCLWVIRHSTCFWILNFDKLSHKRKYH